MILSFLEENSNFLLIVLVVERGIKVSILLMIFFFNDVIIVENIFKYFILYNFYI